MPDMHRPSTRVHRGVAVLLTTCLATVGLLVSGMSVAQADAELLASTPAADATLDAPPPAIELEFGEEIQALGPEVVVTADDGTTVTDGSAQVDGTTVVQPLTADLPAGDYTVDWRATSADGHPVSDRYTFTVAESTPGVAASSSAPAQATTDVGEASATSPADSPSSGVWIAVVAAGVLLAAALVAVLQLRRRA